MLNLKCPICSSELFKIYDGEYICNLKDQNCKLVNSHYYLEFNEDDYFITYERISLTNSEKLYEIIQEYSSEDSLKMEFIRIRSLSNGEIIKSKVNIQPLFDLQNFSKEKILNKINLFFTFR